MIMKYFDKAGIVLKIFLYSFYPNKYTVQTETYSALTSLSDAK